MPLTLGDDRRLGQPCPMVAASSPAVVPDGRDFEDPSGSVMVIWSLIGSAMVTAADLEPRHPIAVPRRPIGHGARGG